MNFMGELSQLCTDLCEVNDDLTFDGQFLSLKGEHIGREISLYDMMATLQNKIYALSDIAFLFIPSSKLNAEPLIELGLKCCPDDYKERWKDIFI